MTPTRLLLACLLMLAAVFGLWKLSQSEQAEIHVIEIPMASEANLFEGDPQEMIGLSIEQPRYGITISMKLKDRLWELTDPIPDAVEPFVLSSAFQALFTTDWLPAPKEWAGQSDEDLGLTPAAALVEVLFKDGSSEQLVIGAEELTGNWRVAKHNDQLIRFPIPSFRKLVRPIDQWRDHRLHPHGGGINKVVWEPLSGNRLVLEKNSGRWYLKEPVEAPLDVRYEPFLKTLMGGRVEGIGDPILDNLPMDEKRGDLIFYAGKEKTHLQVFEGMVQSDRRRYPLSLERNTYQFLDLSLEDLISDRILDLDPERIASVRIEYGTQSKSYQRKPGGWGNNNQDTVSEEESSFVAALLDHGQRLERGETRALPQAPPSGRILYSISRIPKDQGSQIIRWWIEPNGRVIVASEPGTEAYVSSINFELGVASLFAEND